jgi:hypothetical protein
VKLRIIFKSGHTEIFLLPDSQREATLRVLRERSADQFGSVGNNDSDQFGIMFSEIAAWVMT